MKSESHADLDVGVQAGFQNAVVLPVPLVEEVQDFCGHGILLFVAELETDRLFELGKEKRFESFSGQIVYRTTLDVRPGECAHMEFGVENCVSELYVNGVKAGTVWHGRHVYDVAKLLRPGKNELKLVLTTTLGNYMLSLKENPTMVKWSNFKYKQVVNPCGLTWGPDLYRD